MNNFVDSNLNNSGLDLEDVTMDEILDDAVTLPHFFSGDDGVNGIELWASDGTAEGTYMVKDINPDEAHSCPWDLVNVGGKLFFGASDDEHSIELRVSDGTEPGTKMVKDIYSGIEQGYIGSEDW